MADAPSAAEGPREEDVAAQMAALGKICGSLTAVVSSRVRPRKVLVDFSDMAAAAERAREAAEGRACRIAGA